MQPRGFWAEYGAPASVDWCEPNYVVTRYVAEFWNTTTGGLITLAALVGLVLTLRARPRLAARFPAAFLGMAIVGLGTAAFHGTLLKLPQAADELPMIWLSLLFVYTLRFRASAAGEARAAKRRWGFGLSTYAAAFTAAYFTIEGYFAFFLASYATIVAAIVLRSWSLTRDGEPVRSRLFWISSGAYLGGLVTLWVPERALPCDHALQGAQLHALFHLTSLVGTYAWILFALYDRHAARGTAPTLRQKPAPFVYATLPPRA